MPKALVQPPDLACQQRRGEETGEMGTFCKLLFPPRAKPSPLGWLMSCLRWLQVNVKPFMGLPKGREFWGGGRKEWQNLDGIFLGLLHIPRIPVPARRPSCDLENHWFIVALSS